jgi:hypothetical protein
VDPSRVLVAYAARGPDLPLRHCTVITSPEWVPPRRISLDILFRHLSYKFLVDLNAQTWRCKSTSFRQPDKVMGGHLTLQNIDVTIFHLENFWIHDERVEISGNFRVQTCVIVDLLLD